MKKVNRLLWMILMGILPLLFISHTACSIKGTPVSLTLGATATPTWTSTPNNCPPVTVPPPGGSFVLYANGTPNPSNIAFDTFSGGGSSNPNPAPATSSPLGTNTTYLSVAFDYQGGWTGLSLAPNSGTVDLSAYTTCTFWAMASQALSEGFDAAQPSGACTALDYVNLTTCWQKFTIHLVSGSREDSCTGSLTACIDYFVCSQAQSPGVGITTYTVDFDQVQFQ